MSSIIHKTEYLYFIRVVQREAAVPYLHLHIRVNSLFLFKPK